MALSATPVSKGIVPDLNTVSLGSLSIRYNDASSRLQWRYSSTDAILGTWVSAQGSTVSSGAISQTPVVGTWYDVNIGFTTVGGVLTVYIGNVGTRMYRVTAILGTSAGNDMNITIEQLTGY